MGIIFKENKICYLMGDFNFNLLNHHSHQLTAEFLDIMFGYMFFPLITLPTRITSHTATIIDNIFTHQGKGGGQIAPGPEALWPPRNLMLGPSHFFGRNISVFGPKCLCFGGKVPKFGMENCGKVPRKQLQRTCPENFFT
jgi:hypothetical protein